MADDYNDDDVPDDEPRREHKTPNDAGPTDPRDAADAAWQAREDMRQRYNIRTFDEIIQEELPEAWLDDLIYGGRITLVAGEANAGKGWFALAVAAALNTGTPFLTNVAPTPRHVLYVNPERDPLSQRLRAAEARVGPLPNFVEWPAGEPFGQRMVQTFAELVQLTLTRRRGFDPTNCLLILDPLRPLLSGNENDSAELAQFFMQLRQVISPTGPLPNAGTLVTHHTGWQDTQLSVARERGSSDIRAAADVTLVLRNVRQMLAHQKRKLAQQRGKAAVLSIDPSIPQLLTLERHKHRLVQRREDASVLELEPQAIITARGKLADSAWLVRSSVTEAEVEALFEAGRQAAREATAHADTTLVIGALRRTSRPMTITELRLATELPEKRVQAAVRVLIDKGVLVRDRNTGPVRLAEDD